MSDTVFILGAGFSHDAGIPLISGFVEKMWEISIRRKAKRALGEKDIELFNNAMLVRAELEAYHWRAAFDDRNIEDVLSILTFNALGGRRKGKEKLSILSDAIARTIELTCEVGQPGIDVNQGHQIGSGPSLYREFWVHLFAALHKEINLPTIMPGAPDLSTPIT